MAVSAPAVLDVRMFGRPRFAIQNAQLTFSGFPRLPLLFAYLLLHAHENRRDNVAFALWPDEPEEGARANLRRHLHAASSLLPPAETPWIDAKRGTLKWNRIADTDVDVDRFTAAIAQERLEEAASLYEDELLAGFDDEWILPLRARYQELHVQNLQKLSAQYSAQGDFSRAAGALRSILAIDPWREDALRGVLVARANMGDRAGAMAEYRAFCRKLQEEIGAEPAAETRNVYEQISKQFGASARNSNVAAETTRWIGRASEVELLNELLDQRRLVTICGPPGIGKSRLAAHAAQAFAESYDGVWRAQLTDRQNRELIADALLRAMGVMRPPAKNAIDVLGDAVEESRTLFILDACERSADGAAALALDLLQRCPGARVIATSRIPLRVAAEALLRLTPLPADEAAALFEDRAALIDPRYRAGVEDRPVIAGICERLDNIPLAIELAATRMNVLAPRQIADLLQSRSAGVSALRAALEWSHEMFSPASKALFASLAVFSGGCTLDAADAVCGKTLELDRDALLETLGDLVDKSFVIADRSASGMRYVMLDTLREFAQEKLAASNSEDTTRARYRAYYTALAQSSSPGELAPELDNLREVLAGGELRTAVDLYPFWLARSLFNEGREWIEKFLAAQTTDTVTRRRGLNAVAVLSAVQGKFSDAERYALQALQSAESADDTHAIAEAYHALALTFHERGDVTGGLHYSRRSLEFARRQPDKAQMARALDNIGLGESLRGDFAASSVSLNQSLSLYRDLEDESSIAWVLYHLAGLEYHIGNYARAIELHRQSAELRRKLGDDYGVASSMEGIAKTYLALGELQEARSAQIESLEIWQRIRAANGICIAFETLGAISLRQGDIENAGLYYGAADRKRTIVGSKMEPLERAAYEADVSNALSRDAAAWTRGWNRSADFSPDELAAPSP